ncbi:hypothetical protein AOLI_G00282160 [Acnodon oligacanthus]
MNVLPASLTPAECRQTAPLSIGNTDQELSYDGATEDPPSSAAVQLWEASYGAVQPCLLQRLMTRSEGSVRRTIRPVQLVQGERRKASHGPGSVVRKTGQPASILLCLGGNKMEVPPRGCGQTDGGREAVGCDLKGAEHSE